MVWSGCLQSTFALSCKRRLEYAFRVGRRRAVAACVLCVVHRQTANIAMHVFCAMDLKQFPYVAVRVMRAITGFKAGAQPVHMCRWYHGVIARQVAEERLQYAPSGSFLFRESESRPGYSLSVK
jgi:hypothetical protein